MCVTIIMNKKIKSKKRTNGFTLSDSPSYPELDSESAVRKNRFRVKLGMT